MGFEILGQGYKAKRNVAPIVGIDLGTTNSLVAWVDGGVPRVLESNSGERLLPSVVSMLGGEPTVGAQARARKVRASAQTVFSVKRLLGRSVSDLAQFQAQLPYPVIPGEGDTIRIQLGGRAYTPIEISALILRELKRTAETALGQKVSQAVVTVPAYFNDAQRQATRAAGRLAGLDVLRIINEPTAASLAYGLDRKKQGLIAVYDLGGGTFDVSILKLHDGIFEVLATGGDTQLGGDDLDRAIVRAWIQEQPDFEAAGTDREFLACLLEAAERAKIGISTQESFDVVIEHGGKRWTQSLSRSGFESLARELLERTREPCLQALRDAGLSAADLSDVVLVGGPTRLPLVQAIARDIFGREPNTSVNPDEVVALGAAIQADILAGNNKDLLLLDVVPLTLGIETYGGVSSPLIARNSRIPAVARETFTTFVDNQTGVDIHVLQGERDRAQDNRSLARFKLKGIQPSPAGIPRVEVVFLIDADGILNVSARDLKTGQEQSIEVRPSFGLTDAQVESMLQASMDHAQEDVDFRRLADAKNDAEPILRGAERSLPAARRLLSSEEATEVEVSVEGLRRALEAPEARAPEVQAASLRVKMATKRLAELLIKEKISSSTM